MQGICGVAKMPMKGRKLLTLFVAEMKDSEASFTTPSTDLKKNYHRILRHCV